MRQRIGIVFQAFNLFPHRRLCDNISLGHGGARKPRPQAEEAVGLLSTSGSQTSGSSIPDRLSGGQSNGPRSCGPWRCNRADPAGRG